jgi:hypothetical protein
MHYSRCSDIEFPIDLLNSGITASKSLRVLQKAALYIITFDHSCTVARWRGKLQYRLTQFVVKITCSSTITTRIHQPCWRTLGPDENNLTDRLKLSEIGDIKEDQEINTYSTSYLCQLPSTCFSKLASHHFTFTKLVRKLAICSYNWGIVSIL